MGHHQPGLFRAGLIWGQDPALVSWLVAAVEKAAGDVRTYALGRNSFVLSLASVGVRPIVVEREVVSQGEFAFLRRFRDATGRQLAMEVPEFARSLSDDGLESKSPSTALMLCDDLSDVEPLRLRSPDMPLVLAFGNPTRDAPAPLLEWLSNWQAIEIRLESGELRTRLLVLCSKVDATGVAEALAQTASPCWSVRHGAAARQRTDSMSVSRLEARRLEPPSTTPGSRLYPALGFIHDGRHAVEGNESYSWIWTGPDPHFRICVGELPPGPCELRLCVSATKDVRNLDEAVMLFNGLKVPHTLDRWSASSGRFNVKLAEVPPGPSILSIAVPWVSSDEAGTRKLAVCIDKLEVIA